MDNFLLIACPQNKDKWLTGQTLQKIEFHGVRGLDGLKEATINNYKQL